MNPIKLAVFMALCVAIVNMYVYQTAPNGVLFVLLVFAAGMATSIAKDGQK